MGIHETEGGRAETDIVKVPVMLWEKKYGVISYGVDESGKGTEHDEHGWSVPRGVSLATVRGA